MSIIHQPITNLKGVGAEIAKKMHKLELYTLGDLLFHLPFRYQDRTRLSPIGQVRPGDTVVIEGDFVRKEITNGKRRSLIIWIKDATGACALRYFHFNKGMEDSFVEGKKIRCFGEVKGGFNGIEMIHPETRALDIAVPIEERLTPIYPLTSGFSQKQMRNFIGQALAKINTLNLPELLPLKSGALSLIDALKYLHLPPPEADLERLSAKQHPAQLRLAMEEIIAQQLCLLRLRKNLQIDPTARLGDDPQSINLRAQFIHNLPFKLTAAQQRVTLEIDQDLHQTKPMLRLIQGDVGSGKTIVAALSLLKAVASGFQGALMAPTEILAEQHAKNLNIWCAPLNIKVVFLAGSLKGRARKLALEQIQTGVAQIIVGTHALFQDAVEYACLNLIIIDEQHRFGVDQRLKLKNKGKGVLNPHQLIMTATPIPRTLAMSAYADLDISVIDELPPNRTPITTTIINETRRTQLIERLIHIVQLSQQAYWVCTLIEESELLEAQAAQKTLIELQELLPSVRIGLIHGKMKASEKESVMEQFKAHTLDVLVATTVIEVGVDVPNATLMVIENSERLGLSQLHQLRGRVGRGSANSFCVLLYKTPLSQIGRARLNIMRETNDGFKIAEKDLELRGPGEVLGTRQTGIANFKIADLGLHAHLVPRAKAISDELIKNAHDDVLDNLIYRWIGQGEQYGNV
ncbi:ATP-dependent DNA helicase [Gammaproteobacteria bacterium]|nr:ATP-dependent DNA helicase [Gammaproteobacteria bacterium]